MTPPPGRSAVDAIVIGSGPNGLVAANQLADAGWSVTVLEAMSTPGGGVRSAEVTAPGFTTDLYSAFHPMALVSPAMQALDLGRWGLRWRRAPAVVAVPRPDAPAALLTTDVQETAARVDADHPGDGEAWLRIHDEWSRIADPLLQALLGPFPPVRAGLRLAARLRWEGGLEFARSSIMPLHRYLSERFGGEAAALLFGGNGMHTDIGVEQAGGVVPALLLTMIGQDHGFPSPEGGAGALTTALLRRLASRGGEVVCDAPVTGVEVVNGRAVGVRTADGARLAARRAVLADVPSPALHERLLPEGAAPRRSRKVAARFEWDLPTMKLDWALSAPIPWSDPDVGLAGTVHVGSSMDELRRTSWQLGAGRVPDAMFVLVGQMTTTDPTRSPAGTESAWAYIHLPHRVVVDEGAGPGRRTLTGTWDADELAELVARVEARIEELAPGFGSKVLARHVAGPKELERANPNLVGGAVGGGTSALHQQLVFRPVPGTGRPTTGVAGLYLASAAAHPGGGVHGVGGANAARAARWGALASRLTRR